ncbi:MAG TPA: methyltransferase domain-containing protein [Blastocatellia bacterium]|nr:methyltransferase domain-containing protein [Blastocatellia bacterium]
MKWNAEGYDSVATVQENWGRKVIDELLLNGDETVLDAGCGSGRVTQRLLDRIPSGFLFAVDRSAAMVCQARQRLSAESKRVEFICADLCEVQLPRKVDVIFSNAVFHWIPDHQQLFNHLATQIRSGGIFRAQCGGKGNLAQAREISDRVAFSPEFKQYFDGWDYPTNYPGAEETRGRMINAGFRDVSSNLVEAPTDFNSRDEFAQFVKHVVLLAYLNRLPNEELKQSFLVRFVDDVEKRFNRRYWLDYVRLNIHAVKE